MTLLPGRQRVADFAVCWLLQNKMHINDWSAIQTLFDRLNKQLEKIMKTAPGLGVPRAYARILAELEDFLVKSLADKAARKKVCIFAA